MPLPAPDPDEAMPKDLQELAGYMRQHYVEAGDWWENQALAQPAGQRTAGRPDGRLQTDGGRCRGGRGMTDPPSPRNGSRFASKGLIAGLVTLPFRFFGVLCGSLLLCIVIECIGLHFFWPEQGWHHAQGMLDYELAQVSENFTRSVLVQEPGVARWLIEHAYDWMFVKSGLLDWIRDAAAQSRAGAHNQA